MCSTFRPPCFAATHSHLAREDVFSEDAAKAERQGHSGSRERHGVQKRDAIGLFDRNHGPARAPSGSLRAVARVLVCHRRHRPPAPTPSRTPASGFKKVGTSCTRPCAVAALWGLRVKGRAGRVRWTPSNVTRQWGPSLPTGRAPQTMSVPAPASARENLAPRTPPQREGHCAGFSTGSRRQSMIMRKRRAHGLDWRGVGAFRGDTPAPPPAVRVVCVQGGRVVCLSWPACMAHSHRSARVHPQIRDIANNERLVQLSEGYKHQIHELHKYLFCLRGTRARASVFVSPVWGS